MTCLFRGSPKQYWSQNFVYLTQKKDLLYNDTFILPDLVNMASLCSGVGSDLTAPFKLPGWKKLWKFEKIAWKTKKWYPKTSTVILSGMQCHFMKFHSISAFDATFCNDFHQSMPFQCKHMQDDSNVCTRVFCSKTILYYWYTKVMVWLLVVWSAF